MTTFINCTPHAITVQGLGTIQPSGILPRCATVREELPYLTGTPDITNCPPVIRLVRQTMGQVTGLPDAAPDMVYIVSGVVLGALNGARPDVVAPDTGADAIRENGQIVAVRGFVCGG